VEGKRGGNSTFLVMEGVVGGCGGSSVGSAAWEAGVAGTASCSWATSASTAGSMATILVARACHFLRGDDWRQKKISGFFLYFFLLTFGKSQQKHTHPSRNRVLLPKVHENTRTTHKMGLHRHFCGGWPERTVTTPSISRGGSGTPTARTPKVIRSIRRPVGLPGCT
jgi:hypothetical protein